MRARPGGWFIGMPALQVVAWTADGAAAAAWAGLVVVGEVSWKRTRGPRCGRRVAQLISEPAREIRLRGGGSTSRATFLPAMAGLFLLVASAIRLSDGGDHGVAVALAAAGALVAVTGMFRRGVEVRSGPDA